jgi:hypothetical protein
MVRFYKKQEQFQSFYVKLKFMACPHCHLSGCLILHGYLYGYSDRGNSRITRGHRIYCSNRYRKTGCGKTFSVLTAQMLPRFTVSAHSLWSFLANIKNGLSPACAFRMTGCRMAPTAIYRLLKKFVVNQVRIRAMLSRIKDPPAAHTRVPAIQTILHLHHVFGQTACPITDFQCHFQTPFF